MALQVYQHVVSSEDVQPQDEFFHDLSDTQILKVLCPRVSSASASFKMGMISLDAICRTYD
jgi:hypothetical protein